VESSPAIGPGGTVYVGSNDKYLYAVYGDSPGLAKSAWPMFAHDPWRTGNFNTVVRWAALPGVYLLLED